MLLGLLLRGEDEGGPVGEDLGEVGGAVPAAGEGADAVWAAEVGEGGEAVGDGAGGVSVSVALTWFLGAAYLRRLMPEKALSSGARGSVSLTAVEERRLALLGEPDGVGEPVRYMALGWDGREKVVVSRALRASEGWKEVMLVSSFAGGPSSRTLGAGDRWPRRH